MKGFVRILAGLMLLLLLASACSCASEGFVKEPDETAYFAFGPYRFAIDAEVTETVISGFGEQTREVEEAPNCAFDGKGKLYSFSGFEVETYSKGGKNYFYGIYFLDDSISTDREGIAIGTTKDDVIAAYGQADDTKENSLTYHRKGFDLIFFTRDGRVTRIQYLFSVS